jgi:methanogenic corrinoid protein MtbC1/DNA-binding CsgD family transcriptional regulator
MLVTGRSEPPLPRRTPSAVTRVSPVDLSREPQFSVREVEVLALVCRGMSNSEIAAELYLSINSIKTYIRTAYRKIGLDRRSKVIVWALDHGYSTGQKPWPIATRTAPSGLAASPRQRRPAGPRPGFRSDALAELRVGPSRLAGDLVAALGLPQEHELLALCELGIMTLDAALASGGADQLADYLTHAADRLRVLGHDVVEPDELGRAAHQVVAAHARVDTVQAVDRVVRAALDAACDRPVPVARLETAPLQPTARAYLDQVLADEPGLATAVVLDAIRDGMDLGDVLVDVLESAQREIGRLWQVGLVTVAQEHFCTAVTQSSMMALYPYLFTGRDVDRRLVAVHAPGSLHQVGLRMVTDLLEHEGWATTYLGSEIEPAELPGLLVEHGASVLMISASMATQAEVVRSMIDTVRGDERTRLIPVAVGGRLFLVSPATVQAVGADGWAPDARTAVALCNRLAEESDASR